MIAHHGHFSLKSYMYTLLMGKLFKFRFSADVDENFLVRPKEQMTLHTLHLADIGKGQYTEAIHEVMHVANVTMNSFQVKNRWMFLSSGLILTH